MYVVSGVSRTCYVVSGFSRTTRTDMTIKTPSTSVAIALLFSAVVVATASAQNLVITNARIIVGNGQVIEAGAIVVRNGRIASVGAGAANAPGMPVVDARGMTAMPGFIDAHRHIIPGDSDA